MRQIGLHIGIAQRMRFILCAPCYHQSISAQNDRITGWEEMSEIRHFVFVLNIGYVSAK